MNQEIIRSVTSRKSAKTPEEVRALAFELSNSLTILTDLDSLNEVNAQVILRDIIQRLPGFAQTKWDRKQLKSKREQERYLQFTDLVDAVIELSDELNDPLCGQVAKSDRSKPKSFLVSDQGAAAKAKNDAAVATKSRKLDRDPCILCTKPHFVTKCHHFQAMSVKDRLAFARQKSLCFNCL